MDGAAIFGDGQEEAQAAAAAAEGAGQGQEAHPDERFRSGGRQRRLRTGEILGERMAKGGISQFNVKWVGYDAKHNTWEPIENLAGCEDMIAEFKEREKTRIAQLEAAALVKRQEKEAAAAKAAADAPARRARLVGWRRARLLRRRQDARRPAKVGEGLDARALALRGLQHGLRAVRGETAAGRRTGWGAMVGIWLVSGCGCVLSGEPDSVSCSGGAC